MSKSVKCPKCQLWYNPARFKTCPYCQELRDEQLKKSINEAKALSPDNIVKGTTEGDKKG